MKKSNRFLTPPTWFELCKPLSERYLGFRSFKRFNEAVIAKLAWWVLSERDNFCVKVLRAKYKVGNKWLPSLPAKSASFSWRGLENARPHLIQGACRLVGSRENTLVWGDPWIPDAPCFLPQPRENFDTIQCLSRRPTIESKQGRLE